MKTHTRPSILLAAAAILMTVLLTMCDDKPPIEPTLHRAEVAAMREDYAGAQASADSVYARADELYPSQLCRLSVVYKKIDDHNAPDADHSQLETAIDCYSRALKANADSVTEFRKNINPDDRMVFEEVVSITESREITASDLPDEHGADMEEGDDHSTHEEL